MSVNFQSTDARDDRDFAEKLIEPVKCEIVQAIRDVFERDASWALVWVQERFQPTDVFPQEEITLWVADNLTPSEVFPDGELAEWAKDNGYVLADEVAAA